MAEDKEYLDNPQEVQDKEDEYEKVCMMCRRPESKTGKMIDLPGDIHICVECMQKSFDTMNNTPIDYGELMKNMPNVSMIDLSSLQNQIPKRQRVKKKKEQPATGQHEKVAKKVFDIRKKRIFINCLIDYCFFNFIIFT